MQIDLLMIFTKILLFLLVLVALNCFLDNKQTFFSKTENVYFKEFVQTENQQMPPTDHVVEGKAMLILSTEKAVEIEPKKLNLRHPKPRLV